MASVIDILFRCEENEVHEWKRSLKVGGDERSWIRANGLSTNGQHPRPVDQVRFRVTRRLHRDNFVHSLYQK